MSAGPPFTIISVYKIFFRQKKMIRILSISSVLYEKYMSATNFFSSFIKIRERHRDIKEHSNNKVVIDFGKSKCTITSYYKILRKKLHT